MTTVAGGSLGARQRAYGTLEADYRAATDRDKVLFDVDTCLYPSSTHMADWLEGDMAKDCRLTPCTTD